MKKKIYTTPVVKKVELKVMNAILANCHTSPTNFDPKIGNVPCSAATGCFLGPGEQP